MISPGDVIIIAGDSWSCGEWSIDSPYRVTHKGLEYFLTEYGCSVINLSEGGSTNNLQVQKLALELENTNPTAVFWFQTDPMRDTKSFNSETFPKSLAELKIAEQRLLNQVYEKLNNLGITIHCIGGVSKLDETLLAKYSNLKPIIISIIELFGGTHPEHWVSSWIHIESLKISDKFLSELEEIAKMTNPDFSEGNSMLPKEWFFPDGFHPNRNAHHRIFEYILKHHK